MANLAFELGFDWGVPPILGVRDGVFPLQLFLVNDDSGAVISSCDPSVVQMDDTLSFRVYDFSASVPAVAVVQPLPTTLQVLFTSATTDENDPISPLEVAGDAQTHLATLDFPSSAGPSVAFDVDSGWIATFASPLTIEQEGRFNFRALLTVGISGQVARFYRVDPEMVVGHGGP